MCVYPFLREALIIFTSLSKRSVNHNVMCNVLREKKSPKPESLGTCSSKALEETVERMSKIAP